MKRGLIFKTFNTERYFTIEQVNSIPSGTFGSYFYPAPE